jgi:hypothetical protein
LRFNPASAVQVLVLRGSNLGTAGALHLADALQVRPCAMRFCMATMIAFSRRHLRF